MKTPLQLLIAFLILTVTFFAIDFLFNKKPRFTISRKGYVLDVVYWFFTPIVTHSFVALALILSLIPVGFLLGIAVTLKDYQGFGPVSHQPLFLQVIEIFVLGDLLNYCNHRLFHGKTLWGFHAVHHSATEVDWLTTLRLHPVNEASARLVETIPLMLMGFNPLAGAAFTPLMTLYGIFIHADLDWHYGPLRYFIASPAFHRWHHSMEPEAINKNFAGLFAFWDVLFGTFYVPIDRPPSNFGIEEHIPENLVSHLVHPFIKKK